MAETIPIRIILMKAFGSLSAVLALLVIYIIFRSTGGSSAVSSSRTYHRVMFGMSIANILVSISIASTNSTIPVHDETYIENLACDAHAIPMYFGMLTLFSYNSSLCIYYACTMAFNLTSIKIRRCIEPLLHIVPILIGLSFSIPPVILKLYNYNADYGMCILSPYPAECLNQDSEVECIKGDPREYTIIATILISWLGLNLFSIVINLLLVLREMKMKERKVKIKRFLRQSTMNRPLQNDNATSQDTNTVAKQIFGYMAVFLLTHTVLLFTFLDVGMQSEAFAILSAIIIPLQGISSSIIFMWHKYHIALRQESISGECRRSCWDILFVRPIAEPYIFYDLEALRKNDKRHLCKEENCSMTGRAQKKSYNSEKWISGDANIPNSSMEVLIQGIDWSRSSHLFVSNSPPLDGDNHSIGKENSSLKDVKPIAKPERKYYAGIEIAKEKYQRVDDKPDQNQCSLKSCDSTQDALAFTGSGEIVTSSIISCDGSDSSFEVDDNVLTLYDDLERNA